MGIIPVFIVGSRLSKVDWNKYGVVDGVARRPALRELHGAGYGLRSERRIGDEPD